MRFKVAPLIAPSNGPSTATSNESFSSRFLAIICASENEILGAASSATYSVSSSSPFIESLVRLFVLTRATHVRLQVQLNYNLKCTLNFNPKCRCSFRWSIRSTLDCTEMFILKRKHHQVKRQVHPLCHLIVHFQLLLKKTQIRFPFKCNIKSTIKCTF